MPAQRDTKPQYSRIPKDLERTTIHAAQALWLAATRLTLAMFPEAWTIA